MTLAASVWERVSLRLTLTDALDDTVRVARARERVRCKVLEAGVRALERVTIKVRVRLTRVAESPNVTLNRVRERVPDKDTDVDLEGNCEALIDEESDSV